MERLTEWGASISETWRGNDWRLNTKMRIDTLKSREGLIYRCCVTEAPEVDL